MNRQPRTTLDNRRDGPKMRAISSRCDELEVYRLGEGNLESPSSVRLQGPL